MSEQRLDLQHFKAACSAFGWVNILERMNLPNVKGKCFTNFKDGQFQKGRNNQKARDCCPIHSSDDDTNFYFFGDAQENGSCWCWVCAKRWDGFELLMEAFGWDFMECVEEIKPVIGYNGAEQVTPKPRNEVKRDRLPDHADINYSHFTIKWLNEVMSELVPMDDSHAMPAIRYFAKRTIFDVRYLMDEVRFHPALEFLIGLSGEEDNADLLTRIQADPHFVEFRYSQSGKLKSAYMGKWPAIVPFLRTPDGRLYSMHRIFIDEDGNKAPFGQYGDVKKRMSGIKVEWDEQKQQYKYRDTKGAAVHLSPAFSPVLGLAEGLETTLAVRYATGMPMHCTVSAQGLSDYIADDEVKVVVIWVDDDRSGAGLKHANIQKEKLEAKGKQVHLMMPTLERQPDVKSVDWNDVLLELGISGFPEYLRDWEHLLDDEEEESLF